MKKALLVVSLFILGMGFFNQKASAQGVQQSEAQKSALQNIEDMQIKASVASIQSQLQEMLANTKDISEEKRQETQARIDALVQNQEAIANQIRSIVREMEKQNGDYQLASLGIGISVELIPVSVNAKFLNAGVGAEASVGGMIAWNRNKNKQDVATKLSTAVFFARNLRVSLSQKAASPVTLDLIPEFGITYKLIFGLKEKNVNFTDLNRTFYGLGAEKDLKIPFINRVIGSKSLHVMGAWDVPELNNPDGSAKDINAKLKEVAADLVPTQLMISGEFDFGRRNGAEAKGDAKAYYHLDRQVISTTGDDLGKGKGFISAIRALSGF